MKQWLAAFLALALSGCATKNMPGIMGYVAVPESQFVGSIPSIAEAQDNAKLIVKRDHGFLGSGLSSVLLVDGKRIATIKPGQYLGLSLRPGEYLFGVAWSDDLGALETSTTREIAVECKPGQSYYLRMFPQLGSGMVIERSSH